MSHEMVEYDAKARESFRGRATPWVARWLLGRPSNQYFYPMLFRHEIGHTLVHEAGLKMPNVEGGVRKLDSLGLIVPTEDAPKKKSHQLNYLPRVDEAWEPYLDLWVEHLGSHAGEIVVADTVTFTDVLLQELPQLTQTTQDR